MLIDKGLVNCDEVVVVIFSYFNMLCEKGIDKCYFDELVYVLDFDFCYLLIICDMDYVEWLVDIMICVLVVYMLDVVNIVDCYDFVVIKNCLVMMMLQNVCIWYISFQEFYNKMVYFVDVFYQVDKISEQMFKNWQ